MRIQREGGITGDGEVIHSKRVEGLVRLELTGDSARRAKFSKTV